MKIWQITDAGLVRKDNQDSYGIIEQTTSGHTLCVVCDGMGGHLGGSYASSKTVEFLNEAFENLDPTNPVKNFGVWLFDVLQSANEFIYEQSLANENLKGMGTTVSGVVMLNGEIYYAHIGDSRIYAYSKNDLQQVTTDHTYVNQLLLNGLITFKQAQKHPKRHVLTNALGIKRKVSVLWVSCTVLQKSDH